MASAAFTHLLLAQSVSLLFNRQLENETDDHSSPLGVVMNEWRYTSTPHILSWHAQFFSPLFVMFMGMHS
jgi:hypothetical protein